MQSATVPIHQRGEYLLTNNHNIDFCRAVLKIATAGGWEKKGEGLGFSEFEEEMGRKGG